MPDVSFSHPLDGEIAWIHRRTADADIYYVTTSADQSADVDVRFRVAGKEPELWRPDAGTIGPASYRADSGRTTVRLPLTEHDALFVVFRRPAPDAPRVVPAVTRATLATLGGPWRVQFAPGLGAPASVVLPTLSSWTASADSGVKFFSGTATYARTVQARSAWLAPGRTVLLSLGEVRDIAEVVVNGTTLPLVWKAPFEVDVTRALRAGANQVEIRVTNEWTNRLIGDRASPQKRVLSAGPAPFGGPPPLAPSGLLGPVTLVSVESH
jgi:hypothetical protein